MIKFIFVIYIFKRNPNEQANSLFVERFIFMEFWQKYEKYNKTGVNDIYLQVHILQSQRNANPALSTVQEHKIDNQILKIKRNCN